MLNATPRDERLETLRLWLRDQNYSHTEITPAASDASFRRYFRLHLKDETPLIAMDAPPDRENIRPWLHVSRLLSQAGVHVPRIEAADPQQGFVLMEDLGDDSYARVHDRHDPMWEQAIETALETLVLMQTHVPDDGLPAYDERRLREEMELFPHWLLERHLEVPASEIRTVLAPLADRLVAEALCTPQRFTHRDYHSRNLFLAPPSPGVIDFQDAVWGPITYDLVSLLKDCYIDWSREEQRRWLVKYHDLMTPHCRDLPDEETLLFQFDLIGVQRHLKAAGIFARLFWRDGKRGYLDSIPRTLGYIVRLARERPLVAPLADTLQAFVVPRLKEARERVFGNETWTR